MTQIFIRKAKKAFNPFFWLFKWQRTVTNLPLREISVGIIKIMVGNRPAKGSPFLPINDIRQNIDNLKAHGYTNLGTLLSIEQINEIKKGLSDFKCKDPHSNSPVEFNADNAPLSCHTAHYRREDLVKNDLIVKIANDESILKIVQEVLGATPTISNINCWWSYAGRSKAEHAQLFHRDVDDFKFIKLFVYLTDVSSTDGPHIYVSDSHKKNKATQIRRFQDQEIADLFGAENIKSFEEPQGCMFLVDTFGIHKGLLPQKNNRLLLQVQYSLLPLYHEAYQPAIKYPSIQVDNYVNRLLFKQA